ncbi:MAG TPA: serine/threonine-protein kinase [Kofleriaceae bacterium]|nr:serine/threonine-protein kinase [Kofleriaceae bacterium]
MPTAPTVEAVPASSTPAPLRSGQVAAQQIDIMADTAVASRSQKMKAMTPSPEDDLDSGPATDTLDGLVGTVLEQRYEILRKIGQGGMGAVYEATHKLIGKRVAVKVLLDKYAQKDQITARLEQEARLASSIGHANIIDITDIGQTGDGRMFVVMEFLEGESLGALIARRGRLSPPRAIKIARQIAGALGAAHAKGIVHRDVKPDNVFLIKRGSGASADEDYVKVVDFGISKSLRPEDGSDSPRLTQTGMVLGTPLYMSPEQARGDETLDHRIDVYALGVILFEMVTGDVPFRGSNYLNILSQVLSDDAPSPSASNPEVGPDLEAVILKALEKDRDDRYQSMEELAADLETLQGESMASTGARITASRRKRKLGNRSPLRTALWIASIAVVIAAVAVTVKMTMKGNGEEKPQPVASAAPPIDRKPAVTVDAGPGKPKVEEVTIEFVSKPVNGVEVYDGDRLIGTTPFTQRYPKQDRDIKIVGEKDGYDFSTTTFNPYFVDKPVAIRVKKAKSGKGKRLHGGKKGPDGSVDSPTEPHNDDLPASPYHTTP